MLSKNQWHTCKKNSVKKKPVKRKREPIECLETRVDRTIVFCFLEMNEKKRSMLRSTRKILVASHFGVAFFFSNFCSFFFFFFLFFYYFFFFGCRRLRAAPAARGAANPCGFFGHENSVKKLGKKPLQPRRVSTNHNVGRLPRPPSRRRAGENKSFLILAINKIKKEKSKKK